MGLSDEINIPIEEKASLILWATAGIRSFSSNGARSACTVRRRQHCRQLCLSLPTLCRRSRSIARQAQPSRDPSSPAPEVAEHQLDRRDLAWHPSGGTSRPGPSARFRTRRELGPAATLPRRRLRLRPGVVRSRHRPRKWRTIATRWAASRMGTRTRAPPARFSSTAGTAACSRPCTRWLSRCVVSTPLLSPPLRVASETSNKHS